MPIPATKVARKPGCWSCGARSEMSVGIVARSLTRTGQVDQTASSTNRSRSFCRTCADWVWDQIIPHFEAKRA